MSQEMPQFNRGRAMAWDLIKDEKVHTLESLRSALKRSGIKGETGLARFRIIGRIGRRLKKFDVLIEYGPEGVKNEKEITVQLICGKAAEEMIAAKDARYARLAEKRAKHRSSASKDT